MRTRSSKDYMLKRLSLVEETGTSKVIKLAIEMIWKGGIILMI